MHSAAVVVADQDRAVDFYVNVMGWNKTIDNLMADDYRFLAVTPPGHSTGIVLGLERNHGKPAPTPDNPEDCGIYLVSDDLLNECARLKAAGVVFSQDPEPMPWGGHGATFQDIDGNRFFITDAS